MIHPQSQASAVAIFVVGLAVSARVSPPRRRRRSRRRRHRRQPKGCRRSPLTVPPLFTCHPQVITYTTLDIQRSMRANEAPPSPAQQRALEAAIDAARARSGER
jgi:hypothetical protein